MLIHSPSSRVQLAFWNSAWAWAKSKIWASLARPVESQRTAKLCVGKTFSHRLPRVEAWPWGWHRSPAHGSSARSGTCACGGTHKLRVGTYKDTLRSSQQVQQSRQQNTFCGACVIRGLKARNKTEQLPSHVPHPNH